MQCPSCRFENMPGSGHCARCGAMLAVGNVDVMPPRASAMQRRVPVELRSGVYRARLAGAEFLSRLVGLLPIRSRSAAGTGSEWLAPRPALPAVGGGYRTQGLQEIELDGSDWLRLAVPGWVQSRHGERIRGRWMLAVTLGLLTFSLLMAGSSWSAISLGLLFSWHLMATVDAVCRRFDTFGDRIRLTLCVALVLGVLLYTPALWGISQLAMPLSVNEDTRDLNRGDVVWYRPRATPAIGNLVLYEVPAHTVAGRQGPLAANLRIEGQRINRLVAVEGQRLTWQDGILLVDGQPSPWQPQTIPPFAELLVPHNYVYILPEGLVPQRFQADTATTAGLGLVPVYSIHGVVAVRSHPLSRFEKL